MAFLEESLNIGLDTPIVSLNGHTLNDVFSSNLFTNEQLVENGNFSDGTTGWTGWGGNTIIDNTLQLSSDGTIAVYLNKNITSGNLNKFYVSTQVKKISGGDTDENAFIVAVLPKNATSGALGTPMTTVQYVSLTINVWTLFSGVYTSSNDGISILLGRNGLPNTVGQFDNVQAYNISTLITNKQYSPLYQTTFDLMTEEEIKLTMDMFIEKALFIH